MKAAATELAAERRKSAGLAADVETTATELAAETRQSGRWERQTVKLGKKLAKLKEERTKLKKQVVGDGKIVISEKIYVRQQAELASYRKSKKRKTIKERNAEALAPFKPDLEKIKEMMHEMNETEATAPEVDETEAEATEAELGVWRQEADAATKGFCSYQRRASRST